MFDTRPAILRLEMWDENAWHGRITPVGPFVEADGLECFNPRVTSYYMGYQPAYADGLPVYVLFCSEEEALGLALPEHLPNIFGPEHPIITWPEARKRGVN